MTRMRYRCFSCCAELRKETGRVVCPECNRSWKIDGGIIRFHDARYWGEITQHSLEALVRDASEMGWVKATELHFKDNPTMLESVSDLNRACWKTLIPFGTDSSVLDIGSGLGVMTHSLALSFDRVVSLEPIYHRIKFTTLRLKQEGLDNVEFVQTDILHLPFFPETFDVIVLNGILEWVGEWDEGHSPRESQLQFLKVVHRLLKPGGLIVVGIENRFGYQFFMGSLDHSGLAYTSLLPRVMANAYLQLSRPFFYRSNARPGRRYRTYTYTKRGYQKLLSAAQFDRVEFFLPIPGYNNPRVVIPVRRREEINLHLLQEVLLNEKRGGFTILRGMKRFAIRSGFFHMFIPDFLIFAYKSASCPHAPRESENVAPERAASVVKRIPLLLPETATCSGSEKYSFSLYTVPFRAKHVVMIASESNQCVAIAKVINKNRRDYHFFREGFSKLRYIHGIWGHNPFIKRTIPAPIALFDLDRVTVSVEVAATGKRLSSIVWKDDYLANKETVRKHMMLLTRWLIQFFEVTSARRTALPEGQYFQHGDFFVDNIYLNTEEDRVCVIDWDGFGTDYPPLFDYFCLLGEFLFIKSKPNRMNRDRIELRSFHDTFFDRNWFSDIIRETCTLFCSRIGQNPSLIPKYFLSYLEKRSQLFGNFFGTMGNKQLHELYLVYLEYYRSNSHSFILNE